MRLLADTNIVALVVEHLRVEGHDVTYVGERPSDPGDEAILAEANEAGRVLVTKDHDVGALVFGQTIDHSGVLLIDDLGSADEELKLVSNLLRAWHVQLAAKAFVRGGKWGSKIAKGG